MPGSEQRLIQHIRRLAPAGPAVVRGIGDDCAVIRIPRGHEALITTDFSLEGIHFRRPLHPADSVGHRCLARGLSDIAAMGGDPRAAFLSLAAPRTLPQSWINRFLAGLLGLAKAFAVPLAGGDIAECSAGVLADIAVFGSVPRGRAILRQGAQAGDAIYVTGRLGGSAAVLDKLGSRSKRRFCRGDHVHFYPTPRVSIGRYLREHRLATSMIDISDGLSTDLGHICDESQVGAVITAAQIPLAQLGNERRRVDLSFALYGGEDYELLFTSRQGQRVPARILGVPITRVGEVVRPRGMRLILSGGRMRQLWPKGWQHFSPGVGR